MEPPMVMGSFPCDHVGLLTASSRATSTSGITATRADIANRLMASSSDVAIGPGAEIVLHLVPDRDHAARLGDQQHDHDEAEDHQLGLLGVDDVGGQDGAHVPGEEA